MGCLSHLHGAACAPAPRMTLKRKREDEGYPAAKRAKVMDFEGTVGLLDTTMWKECHVEDDNILPISS